MRQVSDGKGDNKYINVWGHSVYSYTRRKILFNRKEMLIIDFWTMPLKYNFRGISSTWSNHGRLLDYMQYKHETISLTDSHIVTKAMFKYVYTYIYTAIM